MLHYVDYFEILQPVISLVMVAVVHVHRLVLQ